MASVPPVPLPALVFAWHEGSQAVARQRGPVREGVQPQRAVRDGAVIDRVVWAACRARVERRDADIDANLCLPDGEARQVPSPDVSSR